MLTEIAVILLLLMVPIQASSNFIISGGYDSNPLKLKVAQASPYIQLDGSIRHSFGSWRNSFKKLQVYINSTYYRSLTDHNNFYGNFRFERRPASDFRQKVTVGGSLARNSYVSWGDNSPYYDSATASCSWEKRIAPFTPSCGFTYSKYTYKEPYSSLNQTIKRPYVGLLYTKRPFNLYLEYNVGKINYEDSSSSKPSFLLKLTENKAAGGWQLAGRKNTDGNELWGLLWRELKNAYLDLSLGQQKRRGNYSGFQYDSYWTGASILSYVGGRGWLTTELSLTSTRYLATPSREQEGKIGVSYQLPKENYLAKMGFEYSLRQGTGTDALPESSGWKIEFGIRK